MNTLFYPENESGTRQQGYNWSCIATDSAKGISLDFELATYDKIVGRTDEWPLDEAGYRRLRALEWVVTEKIHGANFVVATDGTTVRFAKRKTWLEQDEEFFGYQLLAPALAEKALRLYSALGKNYQELRYLFIYGELFGGAYPHPSVPADPRVEAIQTGVYYSPTVEYAVFDLLTVNSANERSYWPLLDALACAAEAGFFTVKPLLVGSYAKAVSFPLGFESTIPARLGLPSLPPSNKAEGVVIKLERAIMLPSGQWVRPALKRKIPEFMEDARYDEARKWKPVSQKISDERTAIQLLEEFASTLLTPARYANAVSKVGRPKSDGAALRRQLSDAIWEDLLYKFQTELEDLWEQLSPFARRDLTGRTRESINRWVEVQTRRHHG